MFSLIIAVIAIALVVAVVAASSFYGGSGMAEATAQAEAARLKTEEQQILGAVEMFNADKGRYPANVQELVNNGYLSSIPQGWNMAQLGQSMQTASLSFIPAAFADTLAEGWSTPVDGTPVFETRAGVPQLICAKYNLITRGDDGILKQVFTGQAGQCYGTAGDYKVVIYKGAAVASLSTALGSSTVQQGDIPAPSEVFWDKMPTGDVKAATDPEKVPFASLVLSPISALDLGSVELGQSSLSASRTLVNEGNIPATGLSLGAGGAFSLAHNSCGATLDAGSSCSFAIQFTPTQAKSYTGNISVSSSNGGNLSFSVQGRGNQAQLSVNPGSASFASTQTGESTTSNLITARNDGDIPTTGLSIEAPVGFSIVNSNCGTSIPAGGSCDFRIKFSPVQAQAYSGSVNVTGSNVAGQSVSVAGPGVAPAGNVTSATFGDVVVGSSLDKTSTVTNTGVGQLSLTVPSAASVTGAGFSFVSTDCGTSLAAGAQCVVTTRYTPTVMAAQNGNLSIASGAGTLNAALSGVGANSVATLTTAGPVTLSDWYQPGTKTATVNYRNDGNAPMTLSSPSLTSPLSVAANTCSNVAPDASCGVTVALTRDANTGGSGSQSFTAGGAGVAPQSITVNWAISSNIASWNPTSLAFGSQQVNTNATKNATLTNNGSAAANWSSLVGLPAGYTANLSACGNVAPAGGSCTVGITFRPTAASPYNVSGLYPTGASINNNTLALTGSGVSNPIINASTSSVSGSATSPSGAGGSVTFTNSGATATTLNLAWVSGGSGISFSPSTLSCPANGTCGTVSLSSSGSAGNYSGTLRATPAAGGSSADVSASFTVAAPAKPSMTSSTGLIQFGTLPYSLSSTQKTFTVTNNGGAGTLSISVTQSSPWAFNVWSSCGSSIQAGQTCTVYVNAKNAVCGNLASNTLTDFAADIYITASNAAGSSQAYSSGWVKTTLTHSSDAACI